VSAEAANAQQIAYWNEGAGDLWVRLQERLDAQLDGIGEHALEAAGIAPGDRVLDVGCGCGASSLAAARRVAPGGRVLGADVSAPMLARARERAAEAGLEDLEFVQADAQTHDFGAAAFDAVVSRFGVMFFETPERAFGNLRRALSARGRLAFVCWQSLGRNPWMAAPLAAVARHLPSLPPPPDPNAPGPFAFADPERVRGILEGGGFEAVRIESLEGTLSVGGATSAEEAGAFVIEMGPAGRALREMGADEALRRRAAEDAARALEPWVGDDGVAVPYAAWRVTGRAPR
jgi:SAM-dependent methyltransferase